MILYLHSIHWVVEFVKLVVNAKRKYDLSSIADILAFVFTCPCLMLYLRFKILITQGICEVLIILSTKESRIFFSSSSFPYNQAMHSVAFFFFLKKKIGEIERNPWP